MSRSAPPATPLAAVVAVTAVAGAFLTACGTASSPDPAQPGATVTVTANVSGKTCALYGYPGVSFVSGVGGSQVGKDAARDRTTAPKVVTLAPGQRGSFALRVVDAAALPAADCDPVSANWLKIFPPENTAALYVGYTAHACASKTATILTTRPVTEGTSGS
jgi:Protein of unknown function (DUF4232)